MSNGILGRFVWHELMTTDTNAAKGFYTKTAGWGTQAWGNDGAYSLWTAGEKPVAGFMELPAEVKKAGVPPHWLTYIGTPNVDETTAKAQKLGGSVHKAGFDIPEVGRIAILGDPQGAAFGVYTPKDASGYGNGEPTVGEFSWHELATTDPKAAWTFYSSLFGWQKAGEMDMGPAGTYQMYGLSEIPMGGIFAKPAEVPVSNWLPYALVNSADASAETAKSLGGMVMVGPMEVPGGERIAVAMDPQGAVLGVHSRK